MSAKKVILSIEATDGEYYYGVSPNAKRGGHILIDKNNPAIQDVISAPVPWTDGDIISDPDTGRFVIVRSEGLWLIPGRNGSWGDDSRADRYVDSGWTVVRKQAEA